MVFIVSIVGPMTGYRAGKSVSYMIDACLIPHAQGRHVERDAT